MELDALKYNWNNLKTPIKGSDEIQLMLKESNHPVLKGIKKQLTIELFGWIAFLFVYYTMFDGQQKPLFINLLLVTAVLFSIIHNYRGFYLAKHLVSGPSITQSLQHYLGKVKTYAIVAVASRACLWIGFILFFTYNIKFTTSKYFLLAALIVIIIGQLAFLSRIWITRLKKLKATLAGFI